MLLTQPGSVASQRGEQACSTSQGRKSSVVARQGYRRTCGPTQLLSLRQHTLAAAPYLGSGNYLVGQRLWKGVSNGHVWRAAQWLENSAEVEVDLPVEAVYDMWRDRVTIPNWMPWIASVELVPEDESLSRWVLSTEQFGRTWTLSWLAKDLTPVRHQKIHWRSVPGSASSSLLEVPNRGSVRFYKRSPTKTGLKLTVSYEIPGPLLPFANALSPIVDGILKADMVRFKDYAMQLNTQA